MTTPTPDSVDSQIAVFDRPRDWVQGDRLSARRLSGMTRAINRNAAMVATPRMLLRAARGGAAAVVSGIRLEVLEYGRVDGGARDDESRATFANHIICRRFDFDDEVWVEMMIAKPIHLQQRNATTDRKLDRPGQPSLTIDYPSIGGDRRQAENVATEERELQVITPAYAFSEPVPVETVGRRVTGVTVIDSGLEEERAGYIDVHGDGSPVDLDRMERADYRNWCHPPTETPRPDL